MLSKKAQSSLWRLLSQLVVATILFYAGYKVAGGFIDLLTGLPDDGTKKSLDQLEQEIKVLEKDDIRPAVPVYLDKNHLIQVFHKNSKNKPDSCIPKNKDKVGGCLCLCAKDKGCDIKSGGIIRDCNPVEKDFAKDYTINPLIAESKGQGQNCQLIDTDGVIEVAACV